MFQLSSLRRVPRVNFRSISGPRWNSTSATPPLLARIRDDLKVAMRAKDKARCVFILQCKWPRVNGIEFLSRLDVLRAVISETNNAAKTPNPIQTDVQLLSLLRKRASASKDAAQQFADANRPDLKEKEDTQITILEQYAGQVETMSSDEIKAIVVNEISQLKEAGKKADIGPVLKSLFSAGGALDGKPVERGEVAKITKEAVSAA